MEPFFLAFSEKLFVQKKTLRRSDHVFKMQFEIHFLTFVNIDRNTLEKI